ncbi:hypothetical protein AC578_8140 [Pseudocercospora eumusae]|uniref:Uncharacterized protein n=1 Tax=Pseudocercospora eumusae TaxID=321146 RepID=A0A139HAG7_9PEZI|nr:hypothetical protein AC578_8140 [Pseudocercospora eumusae]
MAQREECMPILWYLWQAASVAASTAYFARTSDAVQVYFYVFDGLEKLSYGVSKSKANLYIDVAQ